MDGEKSESAPVMYVKLSLRRIVEIEFWGWVHMMSMDV